MPVGGEVAEVNEALADEPELVNKDPYGKGWMIKIKMRDSSELGELLSADDYKKMIEA
jgi:glycine cleavage system H protein